MPYYEVRTIVYAPDLASALSAKRIRTVRVTELEPSSDAIADLTASEALSSTSMVEPLTAEEIAAAVQPDSIMCFEDGKRYKSMKRHLRVHFNLTPAEYRAKWGLPDDFPMVAPNYSARRSELAKAAGLGRK